MEGRVSDFYLGVSVLWKGEYAMALSKEKKAEIVKKFAQSEKDTGSAEVQIAI